MWCDNCKKEVDINSVALNKARGAISMDDGGELTPTMIHSTSDIVNVCKSCGESGYLFKSEASAKREALKQKKEFAERENARKLRKSIRESALKNPLPYLLGFIFSVLLGIAEGSLLLGVAVFWVVFCVVLVVVIAFKSVM